MIVNARPDAVPVGRSRFKEAGTWQDGWNSGREAARRRGYGGGYSWTRIGPVWDAAAVR